MAKDNKICKIVYFDEDSVTDYVQIVAGGELEKTTQLLNERVASESQEVGGSRGGRRTNSFYGSYTAV